MRKSICLVVLALFPLVAFSQSPENFEIYASGGISIPWSSNDCSKYYTPTIFSAAAIPSFKFSDTWTGGFHFGFGLGHTLLPNLSGILDLNYNSSILNKTQMLTDLGLNVNDYVDDATMKMVSINANLKYVIPQPDLFFDPYVIAGAGYTGIAADDISIISSAYGEIAATFKAQDAINTSLGVGVDIRSSESSSLFLEVRYDVSYTKSPSPFNADNFSIIPVRVGIRGTL